MGIIFRVGRKVWLSVHAKVYPDTSPVQENAYPELKEINLDSVCDIEQSQYDTGLEDLRPPRKRGRVR